MGNFAEIRKQVKARSKEQVTEHLGRCIGVNVLFALPLILILIIWMFIVFAPLLRLSFMGAAPSPAQVSGALVNLYGSYFLLIALMFFVAGPLTYGMQKFYIGLSRGEEPGVSILFRPFTSLRSYWTGVKMSACLALRGWLWMLAPTVIYTVVLVAATISEAMRQSQMYGRGYGFDTTGGAGAGAVVLVASILFIIAVLILSVKVGTYMAGYALVHEDERRGVWAATREGSRAFKGHLFQLCVFYLSFLGWYLLFFALYIVCALLNAMGGSLLISALSVIALLCICLVLGTFIGAYTTTSFYGLYQAIAPAMPRGPVDVFGVPIENAAPAEAPQPAPLPTPEPAPAPEPVAEPEPAPTPEDQSGADGGDAPTPEA